MYIKHDMTERKPTCDKCSQPVEPWNNTKVYDAAFEAGGGPYTLDDATFTDFVTFRDGEVVHGDPRQSIQNVLASEKHSSSRHFHTTDDCVGSPSRRTYVEKAKGENLLNETMAAASLAAYECMIGLKEELTAQNS